MYHCYRCGVRHELGEVGSHGERLCGVVFKHTHTEAILCRRCLYELEERIASWQPLKRFLRVKESLVDLIRRSLEARDQRRRQDHERRQRKARKKRQQSEWRKRFTEPVAA